MVEDLIPFFCSSSAAFSFRSSYVTEGSFSPSRLIIFNGTIFEELSVYKIYCKNCKFAFFSHRLSRSEDFRLKNIKCRRTGKSTRCSNLGSKLLNLGIKNMSM